MILVVGATGNIGGEVAQLLAAEGTSLRIVARDVAKASAKFGEGVDVVQGDLREPASLPAALDGVEKVFLVTPLALDQVAMKNTLIDAAARAGVKHIVMSTGIGAAPDAPVQFGRWHGENQDRVKQSGMDWTFVQPTFFMQNFLMSAPTIADHGAFYLPLGEDSRVSWVDARDIAAVAAAALVEPGHAGRAYTLTGPEAVTCEQIAETMGEVFDKPVRYVPVSNEQAAASMLEMGMPEPLVDAMNELYALGQLGYLADVAPTVAEVVGRPARDIRTFLTNCRQSFI